MRIVRATHPRLVPEDAAKVGLVGAAVSDHPKIVSIIETLASQAGRSACRPCGPIA